MPDTVVDKFDHKTTTEVVEDAQGNKAIRTRTDAFRTEEEVQSQINAMSTQITRTEARYVTPLNNQKVGLEAELAELQK